MINLAFWRIPAAQTSAHPAAPVHPAITQARPGRQVKIKGFGALSPAQRQHLQAYGLLPGRAVVVLAQQPVTIVLIEQTELAFETEIARQLFVE